MKPLSFGYLNILVGFLGLAQSLALPASKSDNSPPFNTASLAHPGYPHNRSGTKTRGDRWNPTLFHAYTSSLSSGKNWQPEHTWAENGRVSHPHGETGLSSMVLYFDGFEPPVRTGWSKLSAIASIHRTGFITSTYHPQLTGSASRRPCKDGMCLEEREDDRHATQTHSWAYADHTQTAEHAHHTGHAEDIQTRCWTYSEHIRRAEPTGHAEPTHHTGHSRQTDHGECTQITQHLPGTRGPSHIISGPNSEQPRHTDRVENTLTTHQLSSTRYSGESTITSSICPTARPGMIRTRSDDGENAHPCSVPCPAGQVCSFVEDFDFPQCVSVNINSLSASAENGTIKFLPCPNEFAGTCPFGQRCALVEGFNVKFPMCLPEKNTATSNPRAEVTDASDSVNCTQNIIFLEPNGNHDINITYLGCATPLKPHFGTQGNCLCKLPYNLYAGSPEMPGTTPLPPHAEVAGISLPRHCTPSTIPFGSLGDGRTGTISDLSCPEPFKPRYYMNGTCLCESSSSTDGLSAETTGALGRPLPDGSIKSMSHETRAAIQDPYPPSHLEITGNCRVEDGIDLPDQWDNGDLIRDHTRYICMTGSFPLLLEKGACECIKSHTMVPTAHVGSGEITKTTFPTVHLTGQGPSANTAVAMAFTAERSSLRGTLITAHSTVSTTAQYSLPNPTSSFDIASIIASTRGYAGSFPFNPSETVKSTTATYGSLDWSATRSPTNNKIGPTDLQARAATTASATCPPDFQIVNPDHPHPFGNDCPVIVPVPTYQQWGNMSIVYTSLNEFCHLLDEPSRAYLPYSIDLQPIIKEFCQCNGINKPLGFPPLPTNSSDSFPTLSAAHPKPKFVDEPVNIEIYVGDSVDKGVGQGPRYVTILYAGGLGVFCDFQKTGSDKYVHDHRPKGADRKQVEAEYCKDAPRLKRDTVPTKTTMPNYETINSASLIPTNDMEPVCFEILTGEESVENGEWRLTYETRCYAAGLKNFCHWTELWYLNNKVSNWKGPGNAEQVLNKYCRQYTSHR